LAARPRIVRLAVEGTPNVQVAELGLSRLAVDWWRKRYGEKVV
jgi:hypothetical protein